MDDQFAKNLLEGVLRLPNINSVAVELSSKSQAVEEVLAAFAKAGLFNLIITYLHHKQSILMGQTHQIVYSMIS